MLLGHEPDRAARSGGCRSICPYRMAEYQRGCFVILVAHVAIPERPPGRIPDTLFDGGRRISNGARGVHGAPRGRKTRRPLRLPRRASHQLAAGAPARRLSAPDPLVSLLASRLLTCCRQTAIGSAALAGAGPKKGQTAGRSGG